MKCVNCGAEMPSEAKFCMMCGTAVASNGDMGKLLWKDSCVEVTFAGIVPAKQAGQPSAVCFWMKNTSGRNVVPIIYSLVVNGQKIRSDGGMNVAEGPEIEPGTKKLCATYVSAEVFESVRSFRASVGYCLRGDCGYNYGADQYNFEEKVIQLPG